MTFIVHVCFPKYKGSFVIVLVRGDVGDSTCTVEIVMPFSFSLLTGHDRIHTNQRADISTALNEAGRRHHAPSYVHHCSHVYLV